MASRVRGANSSRTMRSTASIWTCDVVCFDQIKDCHGPQKRAIQATSRECQRPTTSTFSRAPRTELLDIGVTNDLGRRVWEHREGMIPVFTKRYNVKMLVHFEEFGEIGYAIDRETRLKKWKRRWKLESGLERFVRKYPRLRCAWMARFCGP